MKTLTLLRLSFTLLVFGTFFLFLVLIGCGQSKPDINDRVKTLELIASTLESVVYSDFATCPSLGDTADALIRKICQVAQAATIEAKVQLKGELASFNQALQNQIDAINLNLATNSDDIDAIETQLFTINTTLSNLDSRLTSAEAAITALQMLTASINGTLNGTMIALDIGSENISAGPLYETILRRVDRQRFTGFVIAYDNALGLGSNPLTASNGSSTVTVTATAHGYSIGDVIELSGLVGSRGFSNGHVTGKFTIVSTTTNTFTIVLGTTATSNGTLGGSAGSVRRIIGEGLGTLWTAGQASDSAVRISNLGSKRYNFIIRRKASDTSNNTAELCYSKLSNTATFATINAAPEGGNATIICK